MKERVVKYLRSRYQTDWAAALPQITANINSTKNKGLNYETSPSQVNNSYYDVYVRLLREKSAKNECIKKKPKYKIGDNVFLDLPKTPFEKNSDIVRGQIYTIISVDNEENPPLYELENYNKNVILGKFHEERLLPAPNPHKIEYAIDKILAERKTKKGIEYKIRWLFYNHKFDSWIPKNNLIDYES